MFADTLIRRHAVAALALAAVMVSACNGDRKPTTQLAAKVNTDEISVHQVNNALSANRAVPPEKIESVRREILDRLIYQQLAVQQAIEEKLDRSPEVVMAMDAARRDILTRAYFGKVAAALPKPEVDEAHKYYDQHPELFSERRIYAVQELFMPAGAIPVEALREQASSKSFDEIAAWLKTRNVAFVARTERRSAEQFAPEILRRLHALKDGQTVVVELPGGLAVIRLAASVPAPVDQSTSLQPIQQLLAAQQARAAIAEDIERLRAKAKIEYLNEFAAAGDAAPRPPVQAPPPGAARPPAPVNLEKGVAALR